MQGTQAGELCRPFQVRPVPLTEVRAGLVSALTKFQQSITRRVRRPRVLVHQEKLTHLFVVKSFCRTHRVIAESRWLRRGIRIKCRVFNLSSARPEPNADDFVGIGFAVDIVSAGAFRRAPAGKSRYGHIKASPEKMHGA